MDNNPPIQEVRKPYNKIRESLDLAIEHTSSRGYTFSDHKLEFSRVAFEAENAELEISRKRQSLLERIDQAERSSFDSSVEDYLGNIRRCNKIAAAYSSFYSGTITFEEMEKILERIR